MATKKITDLQLVGAVTADISIPGDNGIQTYRLTIQQLFDYILASQNITLPMLKNDIFTGLTGVTSADDDYFPFVDTSDSNKTKKGLVGAFRNAPTRSVTTTDTATASDETLYLSGSSFTQTLPANGTAGKRIKLVHVGTSLTNVYTIATQGGATINGIASGSYKLITKYEMVWLEDNGTNWIIVARYAKTPKADGGAVTFDITTGGTAPTPATSPTMSKQWWFRDGEFIYIEGEYQASATGAADGSGDYIVKPPTGIVLDTSTTNVYDTLKGWNVAMDRLPYIGGASGGQPAASTAVGGVVPYSAKNGVRIHLQNNSGICGFWSSGGFNLGLASGIHIGWNYKHKVTDWQP